MSSFDLKSTALAASLKPASAAAASVTIFMDVLKAVDDAADVTHRVRQNLRTAVNRTANLMSPLGLHGPVLISEIGNKLGKLAPAQLGLKTDGSLLAYKSNLRRALGLAGLTVMPGRHVTPLSAEWQALLDSIPEIVTKQGIRDNPTRIRLSRFAHVSSQQGWAPAEVGQMHLDQFHDLLGETNLGSKCTRVVRETAAAWAEARMKFLGWPQNELEYEQRKSDLPLLPWSAFPPSLEKDVHHFLERDEDWLSLEGLDDDELADEKEAAKREMQPLRPTTQSNYRAALQRIASNLVALSTPAGQLNSLADLVHPPRVKAVLDNVIERTGRKQGGHVMLLALLLYVIARDHVGMTGPTLARLKTWSKKTRPKVVGMSDRTLKRYLQFDDATMLDRLLRMPKELMNEADKAAVPDISNAKHARLALYTALLLETCARSGNIVGLNLETHIVSTGSGKGERTFVVIPANEVKNNEEIRAELSPATAGMLRRYVDRYRPLHCSQPSAWLFARQDGTHWGTTHACTDLKDIVARRLGVDVTPHLMRSLGGKVILDAQPGAIATVQQLLGHKRLDTTLRFYTRLDPQKARAEYQRLLESRKQGSGR
jgi:integrase